MVGEKQPLPGLVDAHATAWIGLLGHFDPGMGGGRGDVQKRGEIHMGEDDVENFWGQPGDGVGFYLVHAHVVGHLLEDSLAGVSKRVLRPRQMN